MRAVVLACLLPLLAAAAVPAHAGKAAETRAKLDELRDRIEAVRAELAAERERRDRAADELARIEQRIGRLSGELADIDERMRATRAELDELAARAEGLRARLERHRGTLAGQLRAAYRLGRQPALRLLLRQEEPGAVARALGYYGYLNDARLEAIERARRLIGELRTVRRETETARAALEDDRAALAERRQALESAHAERRELLARLERSIEDKGERLEDMQASRERLEDLLRELDSVLGDIPAAPLEESPFPSRRGELAWPVSGPLRAQFGSARAGGRMQWRGVVIGADAGADVRAVYYGRVVFADWLSGFGQLLIVDHLDGYMSLYGYNQRLLRSTGDWVAPGDVVATVGASGGRERSGLYFEIRHGGQPVDPTAWLAQR